MFFNANKINYHKVLLFLDLVYTFYRALHMLQQIEEKACDVKK